MPQTIGILQPSYLPWLGFFEQIDQVDIFVLYDDVQFEKGSWRNRNRIKGHDEAIWLTVPVLTKGLGTQLIQDVRIQGNTAWQKKHIKTMTQYYSKAPFFTHYSVSLFDCIDREWSSLVELNVTLIKWLCEELGIQTELIVSSDLKISGKKSEKIIKTIKSLGGSVFYEGASGRNYIERSEFDRYGITIQYQDYIHPMYFQGKGEFVPYLSIIDLLFNCGSESLDILRKGK